MSNFFRLALISSVSSVIAACQVTKAPSHITSSEARVVLLKESERMPEIGANIDSVRVRSDVPKRAESIMQKSGFWSMHSWLIPTEITPYEDELDNFIFEALFIKEDFRVVLDCRLGDMQRISAIFWAEGLHPHWSIGNKPIVFFPSSELAAAYSIARNFIGDFEHASLY